MIPEFHTNHPSCLIWAEGLPMLQLPARPGVVRVVQSAALVRQQLEVNANLEVRRAVTASKEVWPQVAIACQEIRLLVNARQVAPQMHKIPLFSPA
jgi:hypothetical protein